MPSLLKIVARQSNPRIGERGKRSADPNGLALNRSLGQAAYDLILQQEIDH